MTMVASAASLDDIVWARAADAPDVVALRYVDEPRDLSDDGGTTVMTYGSLARRADALATAIIDHTAIGDRVMLVQPPGPDYVATFLACLRARRVAVPVNLPTVPSTVDRLSSIVGDASPTVALITGSDTRIGHSLAHHFASLSIPVIDSEDVHGALSLDVVDRPAGSRPPDEIAFLQYTSGSTGNPKGVLVSHHNLLSNIRAVRTHLRLTGHDCQVSWLPPYHDMGLILGILVPLCTGTETVLMSPFAFTVDPVCWLEAISHFRATYSAAPNFAYELTSRRADADVDRVAALDLSSWRLAINGAEPVRPTTLERFSARFSDVGFRPEAHLPGYGLAEATLAVTVTEPGAGVRLDRPDGGARDRPVVSVGPPVVDTDVRIVDPESRREQPDGVVGEVWVSGPGVANGYWRRSDGADHFRARTAGDGSGAAFLRTEDLGFVRHGHLYVTGRIKDLIIVRGQNHHPHDIEETVWSADARLRPGCAAAFTIEQGDEQRLVVVQECHVTPTVGEAEAITQVARRAVSARHGLQLDHLVLVAPHTVPKTSAGKVRRRATRQAYERGELA